MSRATAFVVEQYRIILRRMGYLQWLAEVGGLLTMARKAATGWRGAAGGGRRSGRRAARPMSMALEPFEPMVMASDLAPYSLIGSAMAGLLQRVELLGNSSSMQGYELSLSGNAVPNVAWGGVSGIRATFAGNLMVQQDDLTVWGGAWDAGGSYASSGFTRTYDAATNTTTATWNVPALTPDFNGLSGDNFIFEFHNSIHNSNHGAIGGDFVMPMGVLTGDMNHDGSVDECRQHAVHHRIQC